MTDGPQPSEEIVEALRRGLVVLAELNLRSNTSLDHLHRATGLPKPTLSRLLKTLIHLGFVTNDRRRGGYQVTSLVNSLSHGYSGDPAVVEASRAWAIEFTRACKWPVAIAVPKEHPIDRMIVRFSTTSQSPKSPLTGTVNTRLTMLDRAFGRAYLAFCSVELQARILHENGVCDPSALHAATAMLGNIRREGFAERDSFVPPENTNTLAVPIMAGGKAVASAGVTYFRTALKTRQEKLELVGHLREMAHNIEANIERLTQGNAGANPAPE